MTAFRHLAVACVVVAAVAEALRDVDTIKEHLSRLEAELANVEGSSGAKDLSRHARQTSGSSGSLIDRVNILERSYPAKVEAAANQAAFSVASEANGQAAANFDNLVVSLTGMHAAMTAKMSMIEAGIDSKLSWASAHVNTTAFELATQAAAAVDHLNEEAAHFNATANAELARIQSTLGEVALRPQGLIVGWKSCSKTGNNGADSGGLTVMSCPYTKKRADTVLRISMNSNQRQINGHSRWRLRVNGQDCRGPNNEAQGDIYTRFHGSRGYDLHRPIFLEGVCYRTTAGTLGAGLHTVSYFQVDVAADSYFNWESSARIRIEEWTTGSGTYQTV